ncbi:hypothetical protein COLO4_19857 [Corchorus olitorius]|uniref:Uncharacterized protein n=1 Tax=Corchorus olitorius TaxID=93759 RepID=A0A1R3J301_9ROSI|nr:hypothetical protein COLO4_19857 [Corchorus olitorius]
MNAEDVFKALEEIEFSEFVKPLKASLAEFRKKNAGKKAGSAKEKEVKKKRKVEESSCKNGCKNFCGLSDLFICNSWVGTFFFPLLVKLSDLSKA